MKISDSSKHVPLISNNPKKSFSTSLPFQTTTNRFAVTILQPPARNKVAIPPPRYLRSRHRAGPPPDGLSTATMSEERYMCHRADSSVVCFVMPREASSLHVVLLHPQWRMSHLRRGLHFGSAVQRQASMSILMPGAVGVRRQCSPLAPAPPGV